MRLFTTTLAICLTYFSVSAQHLLKDIGAGNGNIEVIAFESVKNNVSTDSLAFIIKLANESEAYFGIMTQTLDTLLIHFPISASSYGSIYKVHFFKGHYYTSGYQNGQRVIYRFTKSGQAMLMDQRYSSEFEAEQVNFYENVNHLIFKEFVGNTDYLLSITDGVSGVLPIFQSTNSNSIQEVTLFNNNFIFTANHTTLGNELFITSGAYGSSNLLKDLNPGTAGSNPSQLKIGPDNKLYFFALNPATGSYELAASDGTENGTFFLPSYFAPSIYPAPLSFIDDLILFKPLARLFSFDKNTGLYTDLMNRDVYIAGQASFGNQVLFIVAEFLGDQKYKLDLWKTDGTPANTSFVKNLVQETGWSFASSLVNSNGVFFQITNNLAPGITSTVHKWFTDGTVSGTRDMSLDYGSPLSNSITTPMTIFNDHLIRLDYYDRKGFEFIKSDGIQNWSTITDFNQSVFSSNPRLFFADGNKVFFMASDNLHGRELWETDGTTEGTRLKFDLVQNHPHFTNGNTPYERRSDYAIVNDGLFYADPVENNLKKYFTATDKSEIAYSPVFSTNNGFKNSYLPHYLEKFKNGILFSNNEYASGDEPWFSDGTQPGTFLLSDINSGISGSYPMLFTEINSNLAYFLTNSPKAAWKTDGTPTGTQLISYLPNNYNFNDDKRALLRGNNAYFLVYNYNTNTYEVLRINESITQFITGVCFNNFSKPPVKSGTSFIYKGINEFQKSVYELSESNVITELFTLPNYFSDLIKTNAGVFFTMTSGSENWLYKVNGSTYEQVLKINNTGWVVNIYEIDQTKFLLLYESQDSGSGTYNKHFIISDGSEAGTKEIFSFKGLGYISETFFYQNRFYFNFTTETSGSELWVIDFTCPQNITISSPGKEVGRFDASNSVIVKTSLAPQTELNAGNKIELNPGTLIPGEKPFKAEIRNCEF